MSEAPGTRILLVEDDPNLGSVLKEFLELRNFDVHLSSDGEAGLKAVGMKPFDLCILDVMLPKKDGFELAQQIKAAFPALPVIFVTAKDKIDDKSKGFAAGGDDYLTKPFSMEELILRINAVLKRYASDKPDRHDQQLFQIGSYDFDYQLRLLTKDGESQKLSTKEAELLKLLCQHANEILYREMALNLIWGDDNYYTARSMDVFITKLRKYLKGDEAIQIMNVHGTGYKLLTPA